MRPLSKRLQFLSSREPSVPLSSTVDRARFRGFAMPSIQIGGGLAFHRNGVSSVLFWGYVCRHDSRGCLFWRSWTISWRKVIVGGDLIITGFHHSPQQILALFIAIRRPARYSDEGVQQNGLVATDQPAI